VCSVAKHTPRRHITPLIQFCHHVHHTIAPFRSSSTICPSADNARYCRQHYRHLSSPAPKRPVRAAPGRCCAYALFSSSQQRHIRRFRQMSRVAMRQIESAIFRANMSDASRCPLLRRSPHHIRGRRGGARDAFSRSFASVMSPASSSDAMARPMPSPSCRPPPLRAEAAYYSLCFASTPAH